MKFSARFARFELAIRKFYEVLKRRGIAPALGPKPVHVVLDEYGSFMQEDSTRRLRNRQKAQEVIASLVGTINSFAPGKLRAVKRVGGRYAVVLMEHIPSGSYLSARWVVDISGMESPKMVTSREVHNRILRDIEQFVTH